MGTIKWIALGIPCHAFDNPAEGEHIMNSTAFRDSLAQEDPPAGISIPLQALWWAGKGEWDRAHDLLQDQPDDNGSAWVHAWLHREEGDLPNARYWYGRAGKPASNETLETEWDDIANGLMQSAG